MEIKERIANIFKLYYGEEYNDIIESRLSNLIDIIFYDRKESIGLKDLDEKFLNYYGIKQYNEHIISKRIPFSKYVIENGYQGMMPYIEDNSLKLVIYFPRTIDKQFNYDCVLIHELLHVIDEHLIINEKYLVVTRGGFETMTLKGNYDGIRNYEYFNEIIHQRIAEDITSLAHRNNLYLFNDISDSNNSQNYYMEDVNPVIEYFFDKFKYRLIVDKLIGNTDEFISFIGKSNFELLNKWVKEYYDKFPSKADRVANINNIDHINIIEFGMDIIKKI